MSYAITLSAADVRNAMRFASTEESRPTINGICIESTGAMWSTNGHVLLGIAPEDGTEGNRPHRDVILRFPKKLPTWAEWVTLTIDENAAEWGKESTYTASVYNAKGKSDVALVHEVAGPYPNARQVIPRDCEVSFNYPMPPINGEYAERFAACSENGYVRFAPQDSADRAVRVVMPNPRYVGVLMPIRPLDDTLPSVPSMLLTRPEETSAAETQAAA